MISLRQIVKKFGNFTAVDNISLDVDRGEFFGFLGPNGAGKTTTIKMMTGLFSPTSGSISIGGHNVVENSIEAKRIIGYIPDQPFLYDKLTGREFLYFIGGLFDMSSASLESKIEELITHFEIGEWLDKRTEDYSQGMRQRLGITSSLLHDPEVIIIDEPMVGLDPRSAKIVKDTLKSLSRRGITIFMSTHSLNIVEELCDRIAIIKDGRIIYDDVIDKLDKFRERTDGKFESIFIELTR